MNWTTCHQSQPTLHAWGNGEPGEQAESRRGKPKNHCLGYRELDPTGMQICTVTMSINANHLSLRARWKRDRKRPKQLTGASHSCLVPARNFAETSGPQPQLPVGNSSAGIGILDTHGVDLESRGRKRTQSAAKRA